jgi:YD repeat-containing protein
LFILLAFVPFSSAADDQYKPYLHKAVVPEHPQVKLYGKYSTNLFPGAGTYTYEIEVPKGTNNLQPSVSISYNSQAVKQRPSILGAGWTLPQNYIFRDVNFTPANTTDDMFKLILNGVSYDLIYNNQDGFFHTKIETFVRIQNISNSSNNYNMHWLLTLKDGTQLRFGYNSDSELTSNAGYGYALKWSLDQIEDTHKNNISYSYLEDPNAEDNGTVYIQQILYNKNQKRKIEFTYENSNRSDRRKVYEQGNVLEESRRLSDINVYFNDTLLRRYNFEYTNLNDENSLSSLSKIKYFGSNNNSLLHQATFDYYEPTSFYENSTTFNVTAIFADSSGTDLGIRLIDLNNDGYIDIIQGKQSGSIKNAWINNKTNWSQTSDFVLPEYFTDESGFDKGLRIADLNNDGFPDLIQGWGGVRKAWINNGSGWDEDNIFWASPIDFVSSNNDQGTRLVDFNGDGRVDLLQSKEDGPVKKAYLNTGSGWKDVSNLWEIPAFFVKSDWYDYGTRAVDVNGDGLVDLLQGYDFGTETRNAWLNNGSGWVSSTAWEPPAVFTSSPRVDEGARLIDLNQDGLIDLLVDYANGSTTERGAWINNGNGWTLNNSWQSPEPFTKDGKNIGRRIGDVNGDGFADIIVGYNDGSSDIKRVVIRNAAIPYLLKNITNEFGGLTKISYSQSTKYNNSGEDGVSDIGFNVWVVENVIQDNSLSSDFNVLGNTSYYYSGGFYDYNDSEFRGFNIVNETLADNSIIEHYFHQDDALKGKEYKTITYDGNSNIFSKTESNYNFTTINANQSDYFIIHLDSTANYLYDGVNNNPKTTNISYKYDNYSNVISKTSFGDVSVNGDEKYERYEFVYNNTEWILDKVSRYQLFDSDNSTKLRETKYFYDNSLDSVKKGDLTKQEDYLDDGTGNPVTTYTYDEFGNPYRQTDPLGRTIIYYYGNKDTTNTYPDRRVNELGHAVDYEYDVSTGNLLSETKNGITKEFEYDVYGRIIKEILPYDTNNLPTKTYIYDFDGIAPEIIKVSQKTTSNNTLDTYYVYDGFANLVQIKTPAENGKQVVKNIFYDGLFRVSEEQNPYFDTFSSTISNVSNTTNTTKYNYDALSRITYVINPDGTTKTTTYNKNTIKDFDENNNFKTYYLDAYDRIIGVEEHNQDFYLGDNETYNTTYSYNGADELIQIIDNEGNEFKFTYNSLGQKIQLDDPDLGTWKYEYDFAGNLIKQIDNKGNQIVMGYDGLNRIKHKNTSSIKYNFTYDEQYQGTLSKIEFDNITYSYTYDDRLRPLTEKRVSLNTPIHKTCFFFKVISNSVHSFPNSLKVAIL